MKYASLDIETTGLDKRKCQILQLAIVVDDLTEFRSVATKPENLPTFQIFIDHPVLQFEPYALKMHKQSGLLDRYLDAKDKAEDLVDALDKATEFLKKFYPLADKERYNFAGKNLQGFDLPFITRNLSEVYGSDTTAIERELFTSKIRHRIIDPAVFFTDFFKDSAAADLMVCKKRAGIQGVVTHDALDDCRDVINLVRHIALHNKDAFQ